MRAGPFFKIIGGRPCLAILIAEYFVSENPFLDPTILLPIRNAVTAEIPRACESPPG